MDKTMLELVDRLVATANKAIMAEMEVEKWKERNAVTTANLDKANEQITSLKKEIEDRETQLDEMNHSKSYWYHEWLKLDKEIKDLKSKQATEVAKHTAEAIENRTITAEIHENMRSVE